MGDEKVPTTEIVFVRSVLSLGICVAMMIRSGIKDIFGPPGLKKIVCIQCCLLGQF